MTTTEGVGPPRAAVVVLAAGEGRRAGHETNKVLLPLAGHPVFTWSIRSATTLPDVSHVVLVVRDTDRESVTSTLARELTDVPVAVVVGGSSRHESEWRALLALTPVIDAGEVDVVVVHDAARPLAGAGLFRDVIEGAHAYGAALPGLGQPALVDIEEPTTAQPRRTASVQTPQAFRAADLLAAYTSAEADGFVGTDTASCVERYTDLEVHLVDGDARNIKVTFADDILLAECLLAAEGTGG
jgi:2-C-methyl-D-erythritol 4-phosphate cytidylyltransferase